MTKRVAESERLWLEPLTVKDHLEDYHILVTEELIRKWSSNTDTRNTLVDSKALLISRLPSEEKPYSEMFAIMLPPSSTDAATKPIFAGAMGILRLSEGDNAAEIGYAIQPKFWGRGYAPEALNLFVDYYWKSDRKVQKDVLSAGTEPHNYPSQRVLEKAGFQRGPVIEKAFEAKNKVTGEVEWRSAIEWHIERPTA
ncbi:hypothetical protein BUE80_DR005351 [Diplocarpon rosae]|nr:hypothetical protein BUE80_DR005351 [Diplocarpon rosae]